MKVSLKYGKVIHGATYLTGIPEKKITCSPYICHLLVEQEQPTSEMQKSDLKKKRTEIIVRLT